MPFKKGQSGNPAGLWKPGKSANPAGRPPKFLTVISRESGASDCQIVDCLRTIVLLAEAELVEYLANPELSMLEKIVGRALLADYKTGNQRNLMEQLRLLLPPPKQSVEMKVAMVQKLILPDGTDLAI